MPQPTDPLGQPLGSCLPEPRTGATCETGPRDTGSYTSRAGARAEVLEGPCVKGTDLVMPTVLPPAVLSLVDLF